METDLLARLSPTLDGHYLAMGGVVLVAACLQGMSGIGFAMVSAPLAALFFPEMVPGPLLALSFPLALLAALREFAHIHWQRAGLALAGRALGSVLAIGLLLAVPAATMALLFGVLLLMAALLSAAGWRCAPSGRNVAAAGVASGLMGTITSAGAPPFALVMGGLPAPQLRATLGCVFAVGTALSLLLLGLAGHFHQEHLLLSVQLLPWALLGFATSHPLARALPQAQLRTMLLTLTGAGGLVVIWRATHASLDEHIRALQQAEHLVFLFPVWSAGPPALIKGWLDRVWRPGVAFLRPSGPGGLPRPRLQNLRRITAVTRPTRHAGGPG